MEKILLFALAALTGFVLLKMLAAPLRLGLRLTLRGICGFGCLWLLNAASNVTGLMLPVNAVTVLLSGSLGIPGVLLVALLAAVSP